MVVKLITELWASVPKDLTRPDLNEDAWLADDERQRWALSDGASESYDSRVWASSLVRKYVEDPSVGPAWVNDLVEDYASSVDYPSLTWSQQGAYDRGSFGTLLGLEMAENGHELEVLAIGDSLAIHVRDGSIIATFPYHQPQEFDSRPQLLSTQQAANAFVNEAGFITEHSSQTWAPQPGDTIVLVTDAIGQWLLQELNTESSPLDTLLQVASTKELEGLVTAMRAERRMKLDDSTLVRLVART